MTNATAQSQTTQPTGTAVSVRRAAVANSLDIDAIAELAQRSWPETFKDILSKEQLDYELEMHYTPGALARQMHSGQQFALVFTPDNDDSPVGFCSWTVQPKFVVLHKLYLDPDKKAKGLGRTLLEFVERQALETDRLEVRLNVNRYNKPAIGFYKHLGFETLYEVDLPSGPFQRNDVVMAKSLNPASLSFKVRSSGFKLTEQVQHY